MIDSKRVETALVKISEIMNHPTKRMDAKYRINKKRKQGRNNDRRKKSRNGIS